MSAATNVVTLNEVKGAMLDMVPFTSFRLTPAFRRCALRPMRPTQGSSEILQAKRPRREPERQQAPPENRRGDENTTRAGAEQTRQGSARRTEEDVGAEPDEAEPACRRWG